MNKKIIKLLYCNLCINHISSVLIIIKTFSINWLNYSFDILLSPFSSISSKISSTYSLVGLSTPIYLAIWTNTCSNYPRYKNPLPSISTFLNASSIKRFIFLGSLINYSNFLLFPIDEDFKTNRSRIKNYYKYMKRITHIIIFWINFFNFILITYFNLYLKFSL